MTRTLLVLSLVLSTLVSSLAPTLALAQDHEGTVRTEVFDDADLVSGTIEAPVGERLITRRRGAHHSLISPRSHYIPEMLRSVETL